MKNTKPTLFLGIGLALQGVVRIADRYVDIPNALHHTFMLFAVALMMWGIVMIARSPKVRNSRLRSWKLRLIGRNPE